MMNGKIDSVSRRYMYAVEPVKIFETQQNAQTQKSSFDFIIGMNFNKSEGYNPFHPNVQNSTTAKRLDIMS